MIQCWVGTPITKRRHELTSSPLGRKQSGSRLRQVRDKDENSSRPMLLSRIYVGSKQPSNAYR